jgi:hypothetical protein
VTALVFAASGTAAAAGLLSGDKLIKKHSLSGNRLRNHTITGTQINMNKLGKVPSAKNADHATLADTATNATSATNATKATTAGAAPIAQLTYVANTATVVSTGSNGQLITATCPAGTFVTGGGTSVSNEQNGFVNDSYPQSKTTWAADVFNSTATPMTSTVTAICAPAAATTP